MLLYALTIFVSAFLLFQVQPVIAKMILPWFGGSSAVWSTCLLFFQAVLLLGYLYAHWLHGRLAGRKQALVHTLVLTASVAALPILPNPAWRAAAGNPSLRILALLAVTLGLPYFLLSSTSPLLQAWYARTHKTGMPYRLFALSNFASMLALLSYPVAVEPHLAARTQALLWSGGYVAFVLLCGITAWRAMARGAATGATVPGGAGESGAGPDGHTRALWIALAGCASVLLLAVTTFLTQDVAPIPFLWVLPLSLYLLTFILCFDSPRLYQRAVFLPLAVAALGFLAWRQWPDRMPIRIVPLIVLLGASLFVCCMVCHGELVRIRPHARYLTSFYVNVALGGALGGVFVGLLAPNLFNAYYEFPLGLALLAALIAVSLWPGPARFAPFRRRLARGAVLAGVAAYLVCLGLIVRQIVHPYRLVARNFYGELRVLDDGNPAVNDTANRSLIHGVINHGEQMLREKYRRRPVAYFCPESGIGLAMAALPAGPRRIGVLGLGTGTLAAYGRAGDTIRIYEINPLVVRAALSQFSYLRDTPARVQIAMGDARLVLESEPSQQFDMLVMDAFSGDSVPVHLLTREAFRTYFRHLKPGGIVAVNISNAYLNLEPVVERAASSFGKIALAYDYYGDVFDDFCFSCSWAVVVDPNSHPELQKEFRRINPKRGFRVWTDDFSNLFGILM
ncbi:MAG TPA: fused MFS/spermidine synthase [Bryobacteraceae bacterium]|nr:fused MFS/spermidine synthase [Bryobacteraceae bacterium]